MSLAQNKIAKLAKIAMLKEVELTPKPGLVDRHNSGSHRDMDIDMFYASIDVIAPYLIRFIKIGATCSDKRLFTSLRQEGIKCEASMYNATKNINTHKGMIFSLAVILGAYGSTCRPKTLHVKPKKLQKKIRKICKNLIKNDLHKNPTCKSKNKKTNGAKFYAKTKNAGIREIAASGYKIIFAKILPEYRLHVNKYGEDVALKLTLLSLTCRLKDTTLWARGGNKGVKYAQKKSKKAITKIQKNPSTCNARLKNLNKKFVKRNLSIGGAADMLAITWLLDKICYKHTHIKIS